MNSRELLEGIFRETLTRCDPAARCATLIEPRDGDKGFAVPSARFDVKLEAPGRLWLFGAGKAARTMAEGVASKLGSQLKGGVVIVPEGAGARPLADAPAVELREGTHPDPTELSLEATDALLAAAARCAANEHAIFVLSGGASSLLTKPVEGMPLELMAKLASALMSAGAPIAELNVVRKHLSQVKGGQLATRFRCGVTVLVLSDVAGNFLDTVGSGPFEPDRSSKDDALEILERRLGAARVTPELRACLIETPKEPAAHIRHVLVGSGRDAAFTAAQVARERGLGLVGVDSIPMEDPVDELVEGYLRRIRAGASRGVELIVRYGEPVVRASGPMGRGGRSEHLALLLARAARGLGAWTLLAAGTDGIDGSSDAAGAVVDGTSWVTAEARGLNAQKLLERFDSHHVLAPLDALIRTGPTGNNVQDLHLLLLGGISGK